MSKELQIGFIAWAPNYGDPTFTGAAATPGPGSYEILTIGGPRSRERIEAELAAIERQADHLRRELAALEAMPCEVYDYDGALKCITHGRMWGALPERSITGPCPGVHPSAGTKHE